MMLEFKSLCGLAELRQSGYTCDEMPAVELIS